ncbi:MAG: NifB/NifX family molybdenum-iron cluster-binding protein [bacterium]|nr:NifB/NifX family molybdenum-iron cluster-binding protein [bacterium]
MKICIPTETAEGKTAKVYGHFGSAPYFTIYDTEKGACEIMNNSNEHHSHGTCHPMGSLGSKDISAVVCGGMGMRAIQKLKESGILAYRASGGTVEEIVEQYKANKLEELTLENACAQHGCH